MRLKDEVTYCKYCRRVLPREMSDYHPECAEEFATDLVEVDGLLLNKADAEVIIELRNEYNLENQLELTYFPDLSGTACYYVEAGFITMLNIKFNCDPSQYGGGLKRFPDCIYRLKKLRVLWIKTLGIKDPFTLPEDFGRLKSVEHLRLFACSLPKIPDPIFELTNLTHLDLSTNLITSVPDKIRELKNLKVLNINCNPLEDLGEGLWELKHLEVLDIRTTNLSDDNIEDARRRVQVKYNDQKSF